MDGSPHVLTCPQCGASLVPPSRFARDTTCSFCGSVVRLDPSVVSVARFREAHARWTAPTTHGIDRWIAVDGAAWAPVRLLGRGDTADVLLVRRARPPIEHRVAFVLRSDADRARFDAKWSLLERLRAADLGHFAPLVPVVESRGTLTEGGPRGRPIALVRWAPGLVHGLEAVRRVYAGGVSPEIATWMWRRTLEVLAFLHRQRVVHGAVVPAHLLAHGSEHAVRLVGFGRAGDVGTALPPIAPAHASFQPPRASGSRSPALDVAMSARTIAWILGGDERTGRTPAAVPRPLATLIADVATRGTFEDAFSVREEVGAVSRRIFGAPKFNPLSMPEEG